MDIVIDMSLMATIALGVFAALIARDIFNALIGALFGFGVVTSSIKSEVCSVRKESMGHQETV